MNSISDRWALALLVLLGLVAGHVSVNNSLTPDEIAHPVAGLAYWERGEFALFHHNPPFIKLCMALPLMDQEFKRDYHRLRYQAGKRPEFDVGRDFMYANGLEFHDWIQRSRWVVMGFLLLGGLVLYLWGKELFGPQGGLLSLFLWAISPMVVAHGGLATTDIGATVMGFSSAYLFWRYLKDPTWPRALGLGVVFGLTLASKFTMLLLAPIFVLVWFSQKPFPPIPHLASITLLSLLVLNTCYGFQGVGTRLGDIHFISPTFGAPVMKEGPLRTPHADEVTEHPWLGVPTGNRFRGTLLEGLPLPIPVEYLRGVDAQRKDFESGWYSYFRGETRSPGWWYYYLYGLIVKSPLGTLTLFVFAVGLIFSRPDFRLSVREELLLWLPLFAFQFTVAVNTGMNHHLRYALPSFPFLFLIAGRLGRAYPLKDGVLKLLILCCCCWNLLSVGRNHPQQLAYFNELVGGPSLGHLHMAESSIDWGQDLFRLKRWLEENPQARPFHLTYHNLVDPEVYGIEVNPIPPVGPGPKPGWYGVSTNTMLGLSYVTSNGERGLISSGGRDYFQLFHPVARPGWGIWVYYLSPSQVYAARKQLNLEPLP